MTILEAAQVILGQAGQALHVFDLSDRIVASGIWTTQGKTPRATVEAALAAEIKRHAASSRFLRVAPRTYGLKTTAAQALGGETNSPPQIGPAAQPHTASLTFLDAAEKVLTDDAKHRPWHYRAITEQALKRGLIATTGATPEATMYAQIFADIQRRQKRGERSRFVRLVGGLVGLSAWEKAGLAGQIEQHNQVVRQELHAHVRSMKAQEFEALVGRLLGAVGFEAVEVTKLSGDGGIDARGTLVVGDSVRIQMAVQAKRWKANVQAPTVQQVRGALGAHDQGLIITTSDFSAGARAEAASPGKTPVGLMNGEQFVKLLIEHDILIQRTSYDLLELDISEPGP